MRHQLYGHLPPITKTIQVRRTRHAGHCWRSKDELISDVLLLTPTYGCAKAGRPARTYIQQLCEDTGCNPEDLQEAMNDREKWRERVRDIRAGGATWSWWWCMHFASYKKRKSTSLLSLFHCKVSWRKCLISSMRQLVIDKWIGEWANHSLITALLDRQQNQSIILVYSYKVCQSYKERRLNIRFRVNVDLSLNSVVWFGLVLWHINHCK